MQIHFLSDVLVAVALIVGSLRPYYQKKKCPATSFTKMYDDDDYTGLLCEQGMLLRCFHF